jgi:hypothetical protein
VHETQNQSVVDVVRAEAVARLRLQVVTCASATSFDRLQLRILKWGDNPWRARSDFMQLREPEVCHDSKVRVKRAARRGLRHPETGERRQALELVRREHAAEARHALLAYTFARGLPAERCEQKSRTKPDFCCVVAMLHAAGIGGLLASDIDAWLRGGPSYQVC